MIELVCRTITSVAAQLLALPHNKGFVFNSEPFAVDILTIRGLLLDETYPYKKQSENVLTVKLFLNDTSNVMFDRIEKDQKTLWQIA